MTNRMTLTVHDPGGANRTILLLHGFSSRGVEQYPYDGIPRTLVEAGVRVAIPDLLGHGESTAVSSLVTASDQINALRVALREHAIEPDAVVGYSLGARLAWELLSEPRISRAVLGGLPDFEPFARLDDAHREAIAAGDPRLLAVIRGLASEPFDPAGSLRRQGLSEPVPAGVRPASMPAVLLIAGLDDPMAAPERLTALLPTSRVERMPGDHPTTPFHAVYQRLVLEHLLGTSGSTR